VGNPADVTESDSEDEDSDNSYVSFDTHIRRCRIQARGYEQYLRDELFRDLDKDIRLAETDAEFRLAVIRVQDIPDDIKRQRRLLQEFYTAWKKQKFGASEEPEDESTSAADIFLKMPSPTEIGLKKCEELPSTTDNLITIFSQLSNAFLLFANAYPKYAPTCYKMAEFCFKMAAFTSRILSALWKLMHGLTLSSMETAIDTIESPLSFLSLSLHTVFLCFHHLYSVYVNHVTKEKTFERDEEFQMGYEQPPMESQISAFISVADVSSEKLGEIITQIPKLLESPTDPPKQEEVSGNGASEEGKIVGVSVQPDTLSDVVLNIEEFKESMGYLCDYINKFRIWES
jgi:hypothetical protein